MSKSHQRRTPAAHRIHLGSQWEFEPLSDLDPSPDNTLETPQSHPRGQHPLQPQRLENVSDCRQAAGADYQGRIRLVRRFGRPTGLTPGDRVELVIDPRQSIATVSLNDQVLETWLGAHPIEPTTATDAKALVRFDVSSCLQDRNQLSIELDLCDNPGAPRIMRDVWLEIFASDR